MLCLKILTAVKIIYICTVWLLAQKYMCESRNMTGWKNLSKVQAVRNSWKHGGKFIPLALWREKETKKLYEGSCFVTLKGQIYGPFYCLLSMVSRTSFSVLATVLIVRYQWCCYRWGNRFKRMQWCPWDNKPRVRNKSQHIPSGPAGLTSAHLWRRDARKQQVAPASLRSDLLVTFSVDHHDLLI